MGNSEGSHSRNTSGRSSNTSQGRTSKSVSNNEPYTKVAAASKARHSGPSAKKQLQGNSSPGQFFDSPSGDKYYTCKPGLATSSTSASADTNDIPSYYYTGAGDGITGHGKPIIGHSAAATIGGRLSTAQNVTTVAGNNANGAKNIERGMITSISSNGAKNTEYDNHLALSTLKTNSEVYEKDSGYQTASSEFQTALTFVQSVGNTVKHEDLLRRVARFNENKHDLRMSLCNDGTLQGFLRVHILIVGEINMRIPAFPPSLEEVISRRGSVSSTDDVGEVVQMVETKFCLPPDTTKLVHVTDKMRTVDVIQRLLTKFSITDSISRFVLCEKDTTTMMMRKLPDDEVPLLLSLSWADQGPQYFDHKQFVLKENNNSDVVQWDAFSVPELNNFLTFLEREEQEQVLLIQSRFRELRARLTDRLKCLASSGNQQQAQQQQQQTPVNQSQPTPTLLTNEQQAPISQSEPLPVSLTNEQQVPMSLSQPVPVWLTSVQQLPINQSLPLSPRSAEALLY